MTVATNSNRADFTITSGTTSYPYTFRVFDEADFVIDILSPAGVASRLVLGTDYTVTGAGDYNGGSIVVSGPWAAAHDGYTMVARRVLDLVQETSIRNQGKFYPEIHEDVFDRLAMQDQQLAELVARSTRYPDADPVAGAVLPNIIQRSGRVLAFSESTGEPIAGPLISSVDTVSGAAAAIDTVAGSIANVNTVAGNIAGVNAVAAIDSDVSAVAAIDSDVTAVAGIATDVTIVADNVEDVSNFAGVYYGPSATDPLTRRDGTPLQQGDMYFNTNSGAMRVYGSGWDDVARGVSTPYDYFSGDGSQTDFTLSGIPGSLGSVEAYISGVRQYPGTDYMVMGATLSFVAAPPLGANNVFVRWISTQAINVPADQSVTSAKLAPIIDLGFIV